MKSKYDLEDGSIVMVKETKEGVLRKRAPRIITSAGALAQFADGDELVQSLVKSRSETFR